MKRNLSIKIKAALLLAVFAVNTLVGFACAIGVDMGFNTSNRTKDEVKKVSVHVHADGKKHHHQKADKHPEEKKSSSGKDDCCNDKVVKISQIDKALFQSNNIINPVFFTAFILSYYNINVLFPSQVITSIKYFVRGHHPPIPDIRIAIRSFQI